MQSANLESQLDRTGERLRSRHGVIDRVMSEIENLPVASGEPRAALPSWLGRRSIAAAVLATVALAAVTFVLIPLSSPVTLAQVADAVRAQRWIRGRSVPLERESSEIWMSQEHQVFALNLGGSVYFTDGRNGVNYDYPKWQRELIKYPANKDWDQQVAALRAMAESSDSLGPWLFGDEVLQQERRQVTEDGVSWIEFVVLVDPGKTKRILRVDPRTRLPVSMRILASKPGDSETNYVFDYPLEGPLDVYALGVPRDAKLLDLTPSPEMVPLIEGMAASRRALGDFRLIVCEDDYTQVVYRKGDKWRIELCLTGPVFEPSDQPPQGEERDQWWQKHFAQFRTVPTLVCNGESVFHDSRVGPKFPGSKPQWLAHPRFGPLDLLHPRISSIGGGVCFMSTFYPDLRPMPRLDMEFVPQPKDGPVGCVHWKESARLTNGMREHLWYYLDPRVGYAVARKISFESPSTEKSALPEASARVRTYDYQEFQQSPDGFWYPTMVRQETSILDPVTGKRQADYDSSSTYYYHFDFDVDLPDRLFIIEPATAAPEQD